MAEWGLALVLIVVATFATVAVVTWLVDWREGR